jgi:hypothetical protein
VNLSQLRLPFFLKILLTAATTTLIISIIEILLEQFLLNYYPAYQTWDFLYENSLGKKIVPLIIALLIGGLAVYIGGRQPLKIMFHTSSLWIFEKKVRECLKN